MPRRLVVLAPPPLESSCPVASRASGLTRRRSPVPPKPPPQPCPSSGCRADADAESPPLLLKIYDYQHNLGLVLLERKELTLKHEQLRASSETTEIMYKRERASQQSALAEARKREENLKKSVRIQKEFVANLEKALHGETTEIKISYETKLAEALQMMDSAQKKLDEAEEKLIAAKSLEVESTQVHSTALRSLQDLEDREDQLRRYRISIELD